MAENALEWVRTINLRFRRPMLYPIELRVLGFNPCSWTARRRTMTAARFENQLREEKFSYEVPFRKSIRPFDRL